ncbi:MAG: (2Fe-2S)-binding protein [Thermoplasmatota archaeon]
MTSEKCIVCLCEDVTEHEVADAVAAGYTDLESVKRYTGLATGPCQGKTCVALARRILARDTQLPAEALGDITYRPPLAPVPLRHLAGDEVDAP